MTMSGPSSNLANGLKHAWSHLKTKFQEVSTPEQAADESLLLNQDVTRAGFSPDGTIAPSVTNAVTTELKSSRSKDLGTRIEGSLHRKHYERWAWEASNKMSATFLHSPPDALGYIGDPEFQVVMTTYLGQPCPIMAPLVGRYFGKRATALDRYGANLSAASLPGFYTTYCSRYSKR